MQLEYLPFEAQIVATDELISDYADGTAVYSSVEMTTTLTCGSPVIVEYPTSTISDMAHYFYLDGNRFIITGKMFNLTAFYDGIYRVDIKFKDDTGFARIYNCIFIDTTFKCRLAALLSSLLEDDSNSEIAHLIHYSLVNGSNCGCECDEMCANFKALKTILDNQPAQVTDCGCK